MRRLLRSLLAASLLSFSKGFVVSASTARSGAMKAATSTTETCSESMQAYEELVGKLKTIKNLEHTKALLSYDQLVFMTGSDRVSAARGEQLSAMASVIHEKSTDPKIKELALQAQKSVEGADERRLVELTLREFERRDRVPAELEKRKAALEASAYSAWVKARTNDDFGSFETVLKECFDTAREVATAQRGNDKDDSSLYNVMLDEFEMGFQANRIDEIFAQVQEALVPLIAKVLASPSSPSDDALKGKFDLKRQEEFSRKVVTSLGFDETHGRIDVSVHPFTMSVSSADVRITSRFREDEWYQGLAGTIHEGGHAIFEQNLGGSNLDIDSPLSMGTHESQSLFWERHVGLSRSFWKWAAPLAKEAFGEDFDYTAEQVYQAVNKVTPSLIRVEADELTYPLHVILRYNIERDVVDGKLDVKDVPERWKQDMKALLNVDVPSDKEGCLQDVHWSALAIGYFPTYLLGSTAAAQLAHYCQKDIPDMYEQIEKGEFGAIRAWLTEKIHSSGRRFKSLDELLESKLGEKLNPTYFIDYLTEKYEDIYQL